MRKLLPYLPLLALGPVTGPLTGLGLHYARGGRWLLASACWAGIGVFWLVVPPLTAALLTYDAHLLSGAR